jgi:hypothetical protein
MVISHWCKLIEGLQLSPLEFYKCIENAIDQRKVPGLSRQNVLWPEGGLLSANRVYLRLKREKLLFDICAAQFGTGSFVSYRLVQPQFPWLLVIGAGLFFGFIALLFLVYVVGSIVARGPNPREALALWTLGGILVAMYSILSTMFFLTVLIARKFAHFADTWLVRIPSLYRFYDRITRRNTYYRIDLILMFQAAVHAAVIEIVDKHVEAQHLKPLSDDERKPVLSKLLMR